MKTDILSDIGLSNAEIKVYLSLLELGLSSAGPIIEKSGLQSSVVHMTLKRLLSKGFISSIKIGKKNNYQATNPTHISDYILQKKQDFELLLPELLAKQQFVREKSDVLVFTGNRGMKELFMQLLERNTQKYYVLGASKKSMVLGETWWLNYDCIRSKKVKEIKLIFNRSLQEWNKNANLQIRYLQSGFEPLTEIVITDAAIGIIIWSEKPTGLLLENHLVADSYKRYFHMLWKQSKS